MPIVKPENPAKFIVSEVPVLSWRGGSHIPIEKSLYHTVLSAVNLGMNCFQFFLGSPQSYTRRKCDLDDIVRAVKLARNFDIMAVSHTCYLYNLNGSAKQLCWRGDSKQDGLTRNTLKQLEYELSVLSNFERNAVVIHPGSYKDRKEGMDAIVETLNRINFPENSLLLLENCAGEGNKIPRTFEELKYILDGVEHKDHVAACVDTAHIHGQGDYDLSRPEEVLRMFEEFDKFIGLEKLKLVHLNDSKVHLGAKKDQHEMIGRGKIWGKSMEGLKTLLTFCKEKGIPTCLETSPEDMDVLFHCDEDWDEEW